MPLKSQKEKAEDFRALHHGKRILILPNGWDVPSARVFEDAGFPAIATSSAGLLVSLGYPDGEVSGRDEFVSAVGRIARALSVALSADVVAGFGKTTNDVLVAVRAIRKAAASIWNFVKASDFPIKVMVRKCLPPSSELQRLGVARVSLGPSPSYAAMGLLKRAAKEVLEKGTYENLPEGAITFDELNALAVP